MRIGAKAWEVILQRPRTGPLFPYLVTVREADRATEFRQRCAGLGIDVAVLDVRNKPMMANIKAIEALRGEDAYCGGYLKAHRAGILE